MDEKLKLCTKCKTLKPASAFSAHKRSSSGLRSECKKCVKAYRDKNKPALRVYAKKYYALNKEIITIKRKGYYSVDKEKVILRARRHRKKHKKKLNAQCVAYNKKHREELALKSRAYRKNNKEKIRKYIIANKEKNNKRIRLKRRANPKFRLGGNISKAIWASLKGEKGGTRWEALVGYTLKDLKRHLEKQFIAGMIWGNYGKWHIDHIIPISVFNFTNTEHEDFKKCWALSNLQPLWATDNIKKHNKLTKPFQPSLLL